MSGNIIGDRQEDQRVKGDLETGIRLLEGEKGVWLCCGHFNIGQREKRQSAARRNKSNNEWYEVAQNRIISLVYGVWWLELKLEMEMEMVVAALCIAWVVCGDPIQPSLRYFVTRCHSLLPARLRCLYLLTVWCPRISNLMP